jgi:hypothetical protein
MRRIIGVTILVVLAIGLGFAQTRPSDNRPQYDWPTAVADVGQLGDYLDLAAYKDLPSTYTIDWTISGTAPAACTFRIEGSTIGTTGSWFGLDATAPAADTVPCTSANMIHIANRPVRKLRVYIVSYTAGDGTTSVKFHYTAGR